MMLWVLLGLVVVVGCLFYFFFSSFWLSYFLMFVIVSGLLVVFSYMVSMIPNECFGVSGMGLLFVLGVGGYGWFVDVGVCGDLVLIKMWGGLDGVFILMMVSLLLYIMVVVTWLSDCKWGPVRVA